MLREVVVYQGKLPFLPLYEVGAADPARQTPGCLARVRIFLLLEKGVRVVDQACLCRAPARIPGRFLHKYKGNSIHVAFLAFPVPARGGGNSSRKNAAPLGTAGKQKRRTRFPGCASLHTFCREMEAEAGVECEPRGFPFLRRTSSGSPLLHVPLSVSRYLYRPHHSMSRSLCQPLRLFPPESSVLFVFFPPLWYPEHNDFLIQGGA